MRHLSVPALAIPLAVLSVVVLLAAGPVLAADKDHRNCAAEFDQCQADCNSAYPDDAGKRAACVPKCSGLYAACDAGVAYDKAKPWVEEKAEQTKKFFNDMVDDLKKSLPKDEEPAEPREGKSI